MSEQSSDIRESAPLVSMAERAIDVHGHIGVHDSGAQKLTDSFHSGDAETVVRRARSAGIEKTVVSALRALMPHGGDAFAGNEEARRAAEEHEELLFWAVLDPRAERSFEQVEDLLKHEKCAGIKIHPTEHAYEIREQGARIFDFAAERDAVILTHSGCPGAYPEDFIPFANRRPSTRLILAHLGNSNDDNVTRQVCALLQAASDNIFVDTSSMRSMYSGLIEWAVGQLGAGRILFGSDTPLYSVAAQKARIVYAEIPDDAKRAILFDNAGRLFGLEARQHRDVSTGT